MNFEVKRDDLRTHRFVDDGPVELGDGEALLRVDQLALTANNVTYAAFGEMLYWGFFPAAEGWGRVPAWGYAEVERSTHDGIAEGERVYGYFPIASHLVVAPGRVTDGSFVDTSPHRAALPPIYNQYQRVAGDPAYDSTREREQAILRPLFTTAFLIDDWLADDDMFGASAIVLASASSKTALALAFLLSARGGVDVVGLTSPANATFVRSVGYYDRTLEYSSIADLDPAAPSVFVDMAGGGKVLSTVHHHLGDAIKASCLVGATHWENAESPTDLPGPTPTFFFAPDRGAKRREDWGAGGLEARVDTAWHDFLKSVDGWLTIVERRGNDELAATWLEVLEGRASPNIGYVVSP
jgi:hypothetical protein